MTNKELESISKARPDWLLDHIREHTIYDADQVGKIFSYAAERAAAELAEREAKQ